MRSESAILEEIKNFEPVDGDWLDLDDLLNELWVAGVSAESLPIIFNVFEKFPDDDGAGVFWSIVHGVESLNFDYENELKKSLERNPSFMGKVMLQRLDKSHG